MGLILRLSQKKLIKILYVVVNMAGITANTNRRLASRVVDLYNAAENDIFFRITKRLETGIDSPDWERKKMQQIRQMNDDVMEQISILDLKMPPEANGIIEEGYKAGARSVDIDLIDQGMASTKQGQLYFTQQIGIIEPEVAIAFGKIDQRKVEAIAKALENQLKETHPQILRTANDVYRRVIVDSVVQQATGVSTRRQAVQSALNKFANIGVTSFIDKAGRNWTLGAYSEMACRSGLVQSNLAGTQDRMEELGVNTVIVSVHSGSSDLCLPWEGKILISDQ